MPRNPPPCPCHLHSLRIALVMLAAWLSWPARMLAGEPGAMMQQGLTAYEAGQFEPAAHAFRAATFSRPSVSSFFNLGDATWHLGETGEAILAWERAQWLAPRNAEVRNNLAYARKQAQLSAPELSWFEVCSTWLPPSVWGWIAALSFWLAVALVLLPGILRWPRSDWYQAGAAACLAVFILTTPALAGVFTRARLGIIRVPETALLLTPTREGQALAKLSSGEAGRLLATRGDYLRIRTGADLEGWVRREEFGLASRAD